MYKLTSCQEESCQLSKMTKICSQLHHKKIALMRLKKVGFRRWLVGLKSFLASSFWMNGSCLRGSFWIANYVFLLLSCLELIGVLLKGGLRTWWIRVETTSSLVPFVSWKAARQWCSGEKCIFLLKKCIKARMKMYTNRRVAPLF